MTLDEKLQIFYNSAITDATEKSNTMIEEYKKNMNQSFEEYQLVAKQKAKATLEAKTQHLIQEKNRKISSKQLQFKRNLREQKTILEETIFKDVIKKLEDFMKTKQYITFLEQQILYVLNFSGNEEICIYLNASDFDKKVLLETKTNTSLLIDETDFIGGIKAIIHKRNILIDCSFLSRLEEQKELFSL